MRINNKKAAMEMSIGTIVTIVLLMSVMVLGLVLITNIFSTSENSVSSINDQVTTQINNIFNTDENARIAVAPSNNQVTLKQGSTNKGFAFAVNNKYTESSKFIYTIAVDTLYDLSQKCGSLTIREANSWVLNTKGTLETPSSSISTKELVLLEVPATAPKCTIPYTITVNKDGELYESTKVWVTIE